MLDLAVIKLGRILAICGTKVSPDYLVYQRCHQQLRPLFVPVVDFPLLQ